MCKECEEKLHTEEEDKLETKICKTCGEEKPLNEFGSDGKDKYKSKCKVCSWMKSNKEKLNKIENWSDKEIEIIFDNLLNKKVECINDILNHLNNKSLDDLIYLLNQKLKIKGIESKVRYNCDFCSEYSFTTMAQYLKNNKHFCCKECYDKWQYDSVETKCDNCGKSISVIKSVYNNNKHNFCSQVCEKEHRRKIPRIKKESRITFNCIQCNKQVTKMKTEYERNGNSKFCSQSCFHLWQQNNSYTSFICDNCKKENKVLKSSFNKNAKNHFCNNSCKFEFNKKMAQQNRISYNCDVCGIECVSTPYQYNLSKNHFCSKDCLKIFARNDFNCKEGFSTCNICKQEKPVEEFLIQKRKDGIDSYLTCKVCGFLNRNTKIKVVEGWSLDEYKIILNCLLNRKVEYINDIIELLDNKSLDQLVILLRDDLKIGNTPIRIRDYCSNCNEKIEIKVFQYFDEQLHFCSSKCNTLYYGRIKSENTPLYERTCQYSGCSKKFYVTTSRVTSGNDKYCCPECSQKSQIQRVMVKCDCCGKELLITPSRKIYNSHNFCDYKCSRKYFAEVVCQSEERKALSRQTAVNNLASGKIKSVNTSIQLKINHLLDDMKISYINEYAIGTFYTIDIYLTDYSIPIEINGTFWHSDIRFIDKIKYFKNWQGINRDKAKHTYIKNKYNKEILYLWEYDINNNLELCKEMILSYINNMRLENYHSMNYTIKDGELKNDKNLNPYANWDFENLKAVLTPEVMEQIKLVGVNKRFKS